MSNIIALTLPVEEALERGILIRTPNKRPRQKRYTYFLETQDDEPWSVQGPFASRKEAKAFLMKGGFSLTQNQTPVTTTEHKIGKVTYLVCSSASERATDTLDKKIKKLIRKDMELNPVNA